MFTCFRYLGCPELRQLDVFVWKLAAWGLIFSRLGMPEVINREIISQKPEIGYFRCPIELQPSNRVFQRIYSTECSPILGI